MDQELAFDARVGRELARRFSLVLEEEHLLSDK